MNMDTDFSFFYLYTYFIIYKTMIFDREVLRSVEATRGRATKSHTINPRQNQKSGAEGKSLKLVSDFLCKNAIFLLRKRFPCGFGRASAA